MRKTQRGRARLPVFVFDFGGVVIKWKSNDPIFDYVADRYSVPRKQMRSVLQADLGRLESGDVSMRSYLNDALGRFGKRLRKGDAPDELWTTPFEDRVKFRSGTVRVIDTLRRRGFRVYIFSNTSSPHVRFFEREGWDKKVDGFICSCDIRAIKPGALAFERALKVIGAGRSEVVFIDDRVENVEGARDYCIKSFVFTSVSRLREDLAPWLST